MSLLRNCPLFLAATLSLCSPVWAAPNLWWDHFESPNLNQTDCVKKAESILTAEKVGQFASDSDSVRSYSDKTVSVTECLSFGDKLVVYVMVGSEDPVAGNSVYNALRTGMKK